MQLFREVEHAARSDGKADYFRLHRFRYASILAALLPPPSHVLEVGVTPGQCTRLLDAVGYRVSGVDLEPDRRQELWEQIKADVRQTDLEQEAIPFPDNCFDQVIFSEVIEHLVYSPLPVLRELRRVLLPGGRLIITTPNDLYFKSRLRTLLRVLSWQSLATPQEFQHQMQLEGKARYTTHSRTYTMDELCWLVEQTGLQVTQRRYEAAWEPVGLEWARLWRHPAGVLGKAALTAITAAFPATRSMLLVVAEKPPSL
jgi:SAM-dependent methyltransferase